MLKKILSLSLIFSIVAFSFIYVPSNSSKQFIVVVDAGHGGRDSGANYGSAVEKTLNLDISKRLGPLLSNAGIKVIYTRTTDTFIPLPKRAEIANNANANLFISIHCNASIETPSKRGTETLYSFPKNSTNVLNGKHVAQMIQGSLSKSLGTKNRGIIYRPNLAVLRRTSMPSVICEIGYLSNINDKNLLLNSKFRQKVADSLSNSIQELQADFINSLPKNEETPKPTSTPAPTNSPTASPTYTPTANPTTLATIIPSPTYTPATSPSSSSIIPTDYSTSLPILNTVPPYSSYVFQPFSPLSIPEINESLHNELPLSKKASSKFKNSNDTNLLSFFVTFIQDVKTLFNSKSKNT